MMSPKKESRMKETKKAKTTKTGNPNREPETIECHEEKSEPGELEKFFGLEQHQEKRGQHGLRRLISNLLIVAGVLLILVPLIITYTNARRSEDVIDKFLADAQMAVTDSQEIAGEEIASLAPAGSAAQAPDSSVPSAEPTALPVLNQPTSATPEPQPPGPTKKPTMSAEEIQKRMTGVLIIKKIDVRMVIMDGVDEETLRVAAGRMTNTGNFDEIGNVVLAGHRSYTFGKYFNRLDELEPGDEIVVQTRSKTLKYVVYQKLVVEPDDLSITNRNDTDKILTLFTCTPVVIADHRLVIHAKQVE